MPPAIRLVSDAPGAPKAVGPYSQAVVAGNFAFLSGQIPLVPETGKIVEGDIEAQANQVMKNVEAVLAHLGRTFSSVVKATVFVTDLKHFQAINKIYETWMKGHKPARSTIQVAALPLGAQVEVEVIVAV